MLIIVRLTRRPGQRAVAARARSPCGQAVAAVAHRHWPELEFPTRPPGTGSASSAASPSPKTTFRCIPWLGVMWWGMAAGQWLLTRRRALVRTGHPACRTAPLAWLGRWSLSCYMIHQPVFIGAMTDCGREP